MTKNIYFLKTNERYKNNKMIKSLTKKRQRHLKNKNDKTTTK